MVMVLMQLRFVVDGVYDDGDDDGGDDKDEDGDLDGGSGGSRFHCRGLARRLPTCCNCTAHRRRAYGQLAASWRPAYCKDPTRRLPISSWLTSL